METAQDYRDAFASSWRGEFTMSATPREIQCFTLFEAQGFSSSGAAAWVGNAAQEVGANLPTAFRSPVTALDHGSQGLLQWRLDRLTNYEKYVQSLHPEISPSNVEALWPWYGRLDYQVAFATKECRESYPALYAQLVAGGDIDTLTAAICWTYERPAVASANLAYRQAQARAVFAAAPSLASHMPDPVTTQNAVAIHQNNAAADSASVAGGALVAAGGVIVTHVSWHMPVWGWVTIGVLGVIAVLCLGGFLANRASAAAAKSALSAPTPSPAVALSTPAPAPATPATTST